MKKIIKLLILAYVATLAYKTLTPPDKTTQAVHAAMWHQSTDNNNN